jgi:hypothetical protein
VASRADDHALVTENLGLWGLVDELATKHPDVQIAVDEEGRSRSASELRDAADRAAAGLHPMGVGIDTAV